MVVDLAPHRCPRPDARVSEEWRKTTPRLKPQPCPESEGRMGVCKDQLRQQVDRLHESELAKNRAGLVQERDNAECRGEASRPSS